VGISAAYVTFADEEGADDEKEIVGAPCAVGAGLVR
jgi:hypothetical protein